MAFSWLLSPDFPSISLDASSKSPLLVSTILSNLHVLGNFRARSYEILSFPGNVIYALSLNMQFYSNQPWIYTSSLYLLHWSQTHICNALPKSYLEVSWASKFDVYNMELFIFSFQLSFPSVFLLLTNGIFIDPIAQKKILGIILNTYLFLTTILTPSLSLIDPTSEICLESILFFFYPYHLILQGLLK